MERFTLELFARTLTQELMFVQSVIPKKTAVPILQNVVLVWADKQVRLVATDLNTVCTSCLYVTRPGALRILINPDAVLKVLKGGSAEMACLRSDGQDLILEYDGIQVVLQSDSVESYPELPQMPEKRITLELDALYSNRELSKTVAEALLPAICTESSRFTLNGALMEATGTFVATDGHRLTILDIGTHKCKDLAPINEHVDKLERSVPKSEVHRVLLSLRAVYSAIIPADVLALAAKHITNAAYHMWGMVKVIDPKTQCISYYPQKAEYVAITAQRSPHERTILAKSLSGSFPEWRRVIGTHIAQQLNITTAESYEPVLKVVVSDHDRFQKQMSRLLSLLPSSSKEKARYDASFRIHQDGAAAFSAYHAGKMLAKADVDFTRVATQSTLTTTTGCLSLRYILDALKMYEGLHYSILFVDAHVKVATGKVQPIMDRAIFMTPQLMHVIMGIRDVRPEFNRTLD